MPDSLDQFMTTRTPTGERPLLGLTVLVVEDSLFACEAMRLLCLRSGARIRRADSLKSAHRHLSVYRPRVVIIDLGLPDGCGADLIGELAKASPRVQVILGISGDAQARAIAKDAGADGFLEKPLLNLTAFQAAVLKHLPVAEHPAGPRRISDENILPDRLALQEDLSNISKILGASADDIDTIAYVAQFLGGLARLSGDRPLAAAAADLDVSCKLGQPISVELARIAGLVQERLRERKAV